MKKLLALLAASLLIGNYAFAYDAGLAQRFQEFYGPFEGKTTSKAMQQITAPDFLKMVKNGEKLFVLDVRTPAESGVLGVSLPDSMSVPMNRVFTEHTLGSIPTDRKVVIVCKMGDRAIAVAMGLRQIGFNNTYVLKKGLMDLTKHLSPKSAYK